MLLFHCCRCIEIKKWEIRLPTLKLKIVPLKLNQYCPDILEEVKQWALMGHDIFNSVMTKICSLAMETNGKIKYHIEYTL